MSPDAEIDEVLTLVADRIDVLTLLEGERLRKRDVVDELDYSRSTVNRVIARLADEGLVDDAPRGCRTTAVGSLVADQYRTYVASGGDVVRSREVLEALPPDVDLDPVVLADAEIATPEGPNPYEPYHAVERVLKRPQSGTDGRVRVYVPAFSNPRGIALARQLATEIPVDVVFGDELLTELRADFPEELERLFELERFTGYRTSVGPAYSLVLADAESGSEGVVVIHTEDRNLAGTVVTRNAEALAWIERRFSSIRASSDRLDSVPG